MVEYHSADDSRGLVIMLLMGIAMGLVLIVLLIVFEKFKLFKNSWKRFAAAMLIWMAILSLAIIDYKSLNVTATFPKNAILFKDGGDGKNTKENATSYVDEGELLSYLKTQYGVDRINATDYMDPNSKIIYKNCKVVYGSLTTKDSKKFINIKDFKCDGKTSG